jgi:hypothetical protein
MNSSFTKNKLPRSSAQRQPGFTLVLTLSFMILLALIAVGLLTLSSTTMRTSSQAVDLAVARSNARMALMMAIGELQSHAGPDKRVTARADILDQQNGVNNPPILGVWKSWEGNDHVKSGTNAGRPVSPGNYKTAKDDRFLRWLVSGDPATLRKSITLPETARTATSAALVGEKSVDPTAANLQIHLQPVAVTTNNRKGG